IRLRLFNHVIGPARPGNRAVSSDTALLWDLDDVTRNNASNVVRERRQARYCAGNKTSVRNVNARVRLVENSDNGVSFTA
ncbi:TPA: hypothetical protein N6Y42_005301, partial [Escherichia coli]|nr:hypothetical protein [Escherichia coli]